MPRCMQPPDVMIQQFEGESVLLNVNSGHYFGLDEVGSRMWNVLTTSESIENAFQTLLAEYAVDAESLRRDLDSFLKRLLELGLVDVRDN
jgi:hypothetical protein